MKTWFERIVTSLILVGGYALMVAIYAVALLLLGYASIELVSRTLYEPSVLLYVGDAVAVGLILFFLTRKSLWTSLKELGKQISKNM